MLDLPCVDDFVSDAGRTLFGDIIENLVDILARNFQNHIDPVQYRSGDFALIAFDVHYGTGARFLRIFVISAFARIHCADEHEIRRILDGACDARNHD